MSSYGLGIQNLCKKISVEKFQIKRVKKASNLGKSLPSFWSKKALNPKTGESILWIKIHLS